jgi:three-Cys-motif partner protein
MRFDEIGYWSEVKLDIVREYAQAYSTVMAKQQVIRRHVYIDAFAGAGVHISKQTGEFVLGSPLNALHVSPPFSEYHFIDLDGDKAEHLRQLVADDPRVFVYEEDCNAVLLRDVFPRAKWGDFRRALCLLDPYALNLDWEVVQAAGQMRSIELFVNFMVMDVNRNVLWRNPDKVSESQVNRMDRFWGDRSWRDILYTRSRSLFADMEIEKKAPTHVVAQAYRDRLKNVAGFQYVPDPMPMRNNQGATLYYLFFASSNNTGDKIVRHIFKKYRDREVAP